MKKWFPGWVFPLIVLFATGTVWLRLYVVRTTYLINQSSQMISNANRELDRVQYELARARSPRYLESIARTRFGLEAPKSHQVIHMRESQ